MAFQLPRLEPSVWPPRLTRHVEFKLSLPIVLPLVEFIRQEEAKMKLPGKTWSAEEAMEQNAALNELAALLAAFKEPFSRTGAIRISEPEAPPLLRACFYFRLHLRATALAALPDDAMERLDYNAAETKNQAESCYLFLATIQSQLLQHYKPAGWRLVRPASFLSVVGRWFRGRPRGEESTRASSMDAVSGQSRADVWQVAVLNDPVNLMTYVTAVLQIEMGVSEGEAERLMREVHESKRSMVWQGPSQITAENLVLALKRWHLQADFSKK